MCIPSHCLHHLLPDHSVSDNLRLRGHGFQLPAHSTALHRNSFVTRSLFLYVWFLMCVRLIISNKRLFTLLKLPKQPQKRNLQIIDSGMTLCILYIDSVCIVQYFSDNCSLRRTVFCILRDSTIMSLSWYYLEHHKTAQTRLSISC